MKIAEILQEIEANYPVGNITCKGICVWTYIRTKVYVFLNQSFYGKRVAKHVSLKNLKILVWGLFRYNPLLLFRKYKVWLFVDHERRKIIDGVAYLRVSGAIPEIEKDTLVIEKNTISYYLPKKCIAERYIVSDFLLVAFTLLFDVCYRFVKLKIENESVLCELMDKYHLSVDYKASIRRLLAQYKAMNLFLFLFPVPETVFIECPYVSPGYLVAFKREKIKVVEMQHGVINENHFAYNSTIKNDHYSPDKLFVYGDYELKVFEESNKWYVNQENVVKVGSFILEKVSVINTETLFSSYRKRYSCIAVISGIESYDSRTIEFINLATEYDKRICYVYVPRERKKYAGYHFADNLKIDMEHNIYFLLKECDIHITVGSSTCFEAHYFGKKTVFINFDHLAWDYYHDVLGSGNGWFFCTTPQELVTIIQKEYPEPMMSPVSFLEKNHYKNLEEQMGQLLCYQN